MSVVSGMPRPPVAQKARRHTAGFRSETTGVKPTHRVPRVINWQANIESRNKEVGIRGLQPLAVTIFREHTNFSIRSGTQQEANCFGVSPTSSGAKSQPLVTKTTPSINGPHRVVDDISQQRQRLPRTTALPSVGTLREDGFEMDKFVLASNWEFKPEGQGPAVKVMSGTLPAAFPEVFDSAPLPKKVPAHWGEPPTAQTFDLQPLPGGYGEGSGTLAKWIQDNLDKDAAASAGSLKMEATYKTAPRDENRRSQKPSQVSLKLAQFGSTPQSAQRVLLYLLQAAGDQREITRTDRAGAGGLNVSIFDPPSSHSRLGTK